MPARLSLHELLDHLLGRADDFDVSTYGPTLGLIKTCTALPGMGIAFMAVEALGCAQVLMGHDGIVIGPGLLLGLTADHHGIEQGAH